MLVTRRRCQQRAGQQEGGYFYNEMFHVRVKLVRG
jgi:hypothetical protein